MKSSSMITVVTTALFVVVLCRAAEERQDDAVQCRPEQVHLTFGDSVRDVVVMWSTAGKCSTLVKHDNKMWGLSKSTPGESRIFDDPRNKEGIKIIHRVKLRDLPPGVTYYYQPVSNDVSVGPYYFRVPSEDGPIELLLVGDLNSTSPSISDLAQEAMSGKYSAILHAGNLALNLSSENGRNADRFMRLLEPAVKNVPYLTTPGEAEADGNTYAQYIHRFSMPGVEWPMTLDKMWYSLDMGPVHFISYSTEVFHTSEGRYVPQQHEWLIKDLKLANLNREKVPWIVAMGHEPLYCSYLDPELECHGKTSKVRKGLEDILYHYGVDIILQSYGRDYERSFPMYKGVRVSSNYTNPLGPVHITTGASSSWSQVFNFSSPLAERIAVRLDNDSTPLSFGRLKVINASFAEYQQVAFSDGEILDSFSISQNKHHEFLKENLSENITKQIDQSIIEAGGKPGILNIEEEGQADSNSKLAELLKGDNQTRIIIAGSFAGVLVLALVVFIVVRRMRRRKRVMRRWEAMDINYGKKFYSKAPERDEDNDFEIDMSDGTEPTRKLLTDD